MKNIKKILVTGANGLLGRYLVRLLSESGVEVFAITHSTEYVPIKHVTYIRIDLSSDWSESILPSEIDAIIHLAQSERFRDFPESALDVFKVNIESTARLLDYGRCVNAKKFLYASSGGVYGNGRNPFSENSPIIASGQLGYYLGSKMCGEILAQSYTNHFQVLTLRFFFLYGPGQKRSMLLPRLMDKLKASSPIRIQRNGGVRLNPLHVFDAAEAVLAALSTETSTTFNIAGADIYSIEQISQFMGRYLNISPQFDQVDEVAQDLIGNNALMTNELIKPRRKLIDHLKDIDAK